MQKLTKYFLNRLWDKRCTLLVDVVTSIVSVYQFHFTIRTVGLTFSQPVRLISLASAVAWKPSWWTISNTMHAPTPTWTVWPRTTCIPTKVQHSMLQSLLASCNEYLFLRNCRKKTKYVECRFFGASYEQSGDGSIRCALPEITIETEKQAIFLKHGIDSDMAA